MAEPENRTAHASLLRIRDLHVYYGHAHARQGVDLEIDTGVLAVVGRNGMGKTTLCNAVMGLIPATRGSVSVAGSELLGLEPNRVVAQGVGYVPQGRRVWPSLTVDEHLSLGSRGKSGSWTVERIYQTFPRLAERKSHGGAQLSGGEQQMLAISRALLGNPWLLVMDEPTEGLAPVIVQQLSEMLRRLAEEGEITVLLIEQNLGVPSTLPTVWRLWSTDESPRSCLQRNSPGTWPCNNGSWVCGPLKRSMRSKALLRRMPRRQPNPWFSGCGEPGSH